MRKERNYYKFSPSNSFQLSPIVTWADSLLPPSFIPFSLTVLLSVSWRVRIVFFLQFSSFFFMFLFPFSYHPHRPTSSPLLLWVAKLGQEDKRRLRKAAALRRCRCRSTKKRLSFRNIATYHWEDPRVHNPWKMKVEKQKGRSWKTMNQEEITLLSFPFPFSFPFLSFLPKTCTCCRHAHTTRSATYVTMATSNYLKRKKSENRGKKSRRCDHDHARRIVLVLCVSVSSPHGH